MAETLWRCEAHGSDWYRDWCVVTEMARREGHRVVDLDPCRPVEGVWSAPGELIDPANVDYEAARDAMVKTHPPLKPPYWGIDVLARVAVDAALGVGEPEGSE